MSRSLRFAAFVSAIVVAATPAGGAPDEVEAQRFPAPEPVTAIAVSPDASRVYAGGRSGAIHVLDAATMQVRGQLVGHKMEVEFLGFAGGDPTALVSSGWREGVRLWNGTTGALRRQFELPAAAPGVDASLARQFAVGVARRQPLFVVATPDHKAVVWDAAADAQVARFEFEGFATAAALSPDGMRVALCVVGLPGGGERIEVRSVADGGVVWALGGRLRDDPFDADHWSGPVEFSPDGTLLVIFGVGSEKDHSPSAQRVVNAGSGTLLWASTCGRGAFSVAFAPSGDRIASVSGKGVTLCDATRGAYLPWVDVVEGGASHLVFSPDGHWLLGAAVESEQVLRWDMSAHVEQLDLATPRAEAPPAAISHGGRVEAIAVAPDGKLVATGGEDGAVRVWDLATGVKVREIAAHDGPVTWLGFVASSSNDLASAGADGTLRCWTVSTGMRRCDIDVRATAPSGKPVPKTPKKAAPAEESVEPDDVVCAASPSAREIAAITPTGGVCLFDAQTGKALAVIVSGDTPTGPAVYRPSRIAFTPDGRRLASVGEAADEGRPHGMRVFERPAGRGAWPMESSAPTRLPGPALSFDLWRFVGVTADGASVVAVSCSNQFQAETRNVNTSIVLRCWDRATGAPRWTRVSKAPNLMPEAALSPRGDLLALTALDRTIRLHATSDGRETGTLPTGEDCATCLAWSPDGGRLFAGTAKGKVVSWEVPAGK